MPHPRAGRRAPNPQAPDTGQFISSRTPDERAQLKAAILEDVEAGDPFETACRTHGLARRTASDWMERDAEWGAAITEAREAIADRLLGLATRMASGTLRGGESRADGAMLRFMLSRRHPDFRAPSENISRAAVVVESQVADSPHIADTRLVLATAPSNGENRRRDDDGLAS